MSRRGWRSTIRGVWQMVGTAVLPCLLVLAIGAPAIVSAHELEEASATITVRAGGHVELRLQVPWAVVLREALAPGRPMAELLGQLASEPAPLFARRYSQITNRMARETRLLDPSGRVMTLSRWQWPVAAVVQQALRDELMSRMVDGAAFRHVSRLTASAEAIVVAPVPNVRLGLPPLLGPTLVTVVRPEEQWIGRGQLTPPIILRAGTTERR